MVAAAAFSTEPVLLELKQKEGLAFREAFSSSHITEVFERYDIDFRDRALPPDVTLMAFCSQIISENKSCREAVVKINRDREILGLKPISSSTSAYCQARNRIPAALIKDLAVGTGAMIESGVPKEWLWKGHHAKLLDGSTLSMPDTPENQARWPQHGQQAEGVGFPIMRTVSLMSLATGSCLGFAYGPYHGKETGEHALARELLPLIGENDVIIADRYYCSYFLIAQAVIQNSHIIMRLHGARNHDFREGQRLGKGDHIVELLIPPRPKWMDEETYEKIPKTLQLREMKGGIKDEDGEEVIVVTTLTNLDVYPRSEVLAAYKLRWNVEVDFKALKSVMGMDILSCKTPDMIEKEIWTFILSYNLMKQLICQAAIKHNLEPRTISFAGALQVFNSYLPLFSLNQPDLSQRMYNSMINMIATMKIPNRPGRSEPRAVKRRPKAYPLLKTPRNQARKSPSS